MSANHLPPTQHAHTDEKPPITPHSGAIDDVLRAQLEREAADARGLWQKRQLASGTIIAFRAHPVRNEWNLAFIRDTAPDGLAAQALWESEVRTLQIALGARRWTRGDDLFNAEGGIAAAFVSR